MVRVEVIEQQVKMEVRSRVTVKSQSSRNRRFAGSVTD